MRQRFAPLLFFLVVYLGYAAVQLFAPGDSPAARWLSLGLLGLMIAAVVWARRRQDEVMRLVSSRATEFGFWVGFLTLYLAADWRWSGVGWPWPLWTLPLLAWVAGYGWALWRLR